MATTDLARILRPSFNTLKRVSPAYLTFLSPKNANGFTITANQIQMLKIGTKISNKTYQQLLPPGQPSFCISK